MKSATHTKGGFTRVELIFSLAAVLLLVVILLAAPRWRAQRQLEGCKQNLKVIAVAFHLWFVDHEEYAKPPWLTPVSHGGTLGIEPVTLRSQCWFQMMCLSNELRSPKFLVDPADKGARIANTWDAAAQSGFAAPPFQDNAVSYAIGLDWSFPPRLTLFNDRQINALLFADRHLTGEVRVEECSAGFAATAFKQPLRVRWSREIHGPKIGYVAFMDTSVEMTRPETLKDVLAVDGLTLDQSAHFLFPRRSPAPIR